MSESAMAQSTVPRPRPNSKYFFIRRRPRLRDLPREWTPPADEAVYAQMVANEGFIAPAQVQAANSQALVEDVRELEQYLMPQFWRMDQLAKYYQNRHYLYQWTFIVTAFLTTALSALTVYLHTTGDLELAGFTLTSALGALTALVSGASSAVAFLNANQAPQQRWFKARAQAESLRSLYFVFLARQAPFNVASGRERVQQLGRAVLDVLRDKEKERDNR